MAAPKKLPFPKGASKAVAAAGPALGSVLSVADALTGIKEVLGIIRDIQKEQTEQTRLKEQAMVEVERTREMRDVLMSYLDRSFDERRDNFKSLFDRLDKAIDADNTQMAGEILKSVVSLAATSPFKPILDGDTDKLRPMLKGRTDWGAI